MPVQGPRRATYVANSRTEISRAAAAIEIALAFSRTLSMRRTSSNSARWTVVTGSPSTHDHSVQESCSSVRVNRGSGRSFECTTSGTGSSRWPPADVPSKNVAPCHRSAAQPVTAPYDLIRPACSTIRCSTTSPSTSLGTYLPHEVCRHRGPRA